MNKNIIYSIIFLLVVIISTHFTSVSLKKHYDVKTIDTIICKEMEGYTEDIDTGERCLVKWNECDTIYEK